MRFASDLYHCWPHILSSPILATAASNSLEQIERVSFGRLTSAARHRLVRIKQPQQAGQGMTSEFPDTGSGTAVPKVRLIIKEAGVFAAYMYLQLSPQDHICSTCSTELANAN